MLLTVFFPPHQHGSWSIALCYPPYAQHCSSQVAVECLPDQHLCWTLSPHVGSHPLHCGSINWRGWMPGILGTSLQSTFLVFLTWILDLLSVWFLAVWLWHRQNFGTRFWSWWWPVWWLQIYLMTYCQCTSQLHQFHFACPSPNLTHIGILTTGGRSALQIMPIHKKTISSSSSSSCFLTSHQTNSSMSCWRDIPTMVVPAFHVSVS